MERLDSYSDAYFVTKVPTRLKTFNGYIFITVFTVQCIQNMSQRANFAPTTPPSESLYSHINTAPLMLHTTKPQPLREFNYESTSFEQLESV